MPAVPAAGRTKSGKTKRTYNQKHNLKNKSKEN